MGIALRIPLQVLAGKGEGGGWAGEVDVVGLEDAAAVGAVGVALAEAFEGGFLVAEGGEEGEGEFGRVEGRFGEGGAEVFRDVGLDRKSVV